MRRSFASVALLAVFAAACSDTQPTGTTELQPGGPLLTTAPALTLSQQIDAMIVDFFPKGLETATGARWETVRQKKESGDIEGAKKHYFTLADWIKKKTPEVTLDATKYPDLTTKVQAATRVVLAMGLWLFEGDNAVLPELAPDATFAAVPAGQPAELATTSQQASLQLDAGSTAEDRVFLIFEDPTAYPGVCNGPLDTPLCQYPKFYKFESFPKIPLTQPARFAVCLDPTGRVPLDRPTEHEVHERLRLAHERPPAEFGDAALTPGGQVVGNIEILPPSERGGDLAHCSEVQHVMGPDAPAGGWLGVGQRMLSTLAGFAGRILTPRNLYAYDRGPEHDGTFFSHFNAVDPMSQPDLSAVDQTVSTASVTAGGTVDVSFAVANTSRRHGGEATAAGEPVYADIVLSSVPGAPAFEAQLARIEIPALRPDDRFPAAGLETRTVTIPLSAEVINTPTTYDLRVVVSANPGLAEVSVTNNVSSRSIRVDPRPADVSVASGPAVTSTGPYFPGSQITFGWTAANTGFTNSGAAMLRRFTLSTDQELGNADDVALGDQVHGDVAAQTTTEALASIQTLPATLTPGTYYVYLTLDPTGLVTESNEGNNVARSAVTFTVDPPFAAQFGFEDGEEPWLVNGFWHRSTLAGIVNGRFGALPAPFTGTHALWYGRDATGNFLSPFGGANAGTARSPGFTMPTSPSGGQVALEFKTWWEIEGAAPNIFDIMSVELEVTTVTGSVQIRVLRRLNPTASAFGVTYSSGGSNQPPIWVTHSLPIPADIQGRPVRIRLSFSTGDGLFNDMRGWIVDDMRVRVGASGLGSLSSGSLKPLLSTSGSEEELVPAHEIVFPVRPQEP
jgi:hypothetical protein